jgi:hypothetical protein
MSDSGLAALDDMIERLKAFGASDVGARVAKKAAPLVDAAVKKTVKAGQTPMGATWKPKKDGGRPLVNAANHIQTNARGNYVSSTLTGPDVYHNIGAGRSPHRQILPQSGTIPAGVSRALMQAAKEVFEEITKGGK